MRILDLWIVIALICFVVLAARLHFPDDLARYLGLMPSFELATGSYWVVEARDADVKKGAVNAGAEGSVCPAKGADTAPQTVTAAKPTDPEPKTTAGADAASKATVTKTEQQTPAAPAASNAPATKVVVFICPSAEDLGEAAGDAGTGVYVSVCPGSAESSGATAQTDPEPTGETADAAGTGAAPKADEPAAAAPQTKFSTAKVVALFCPPSKQCTALVSASDEPLQLGAGTYEFRPKTETGVPPC